MEDNNILFFGLAAVGLYLFSQNKQNNQQNQVKAWFVPGVGYVPENQLSNFGYYLFQPAGGYVHYTQIQAFLAAGGSETSTPNDPNGPDPSVWEILLDSGLEIFDIIIDTDWGGGNGSTDPLGGGAGTDYDNPWAKYRP